MTEGGRTRCTCYSWTHTQREELAPLPGSCVPWLYRNLDTALPREPPLGGCVKEEQELRCMGRARQVWTCPPTRDTEGTGKAGTVRATGLLRGRISGTLHELCAWQGAWGLPTWREHRETELPKGLTGIPAHKFGEGRIGVSCLCSQQAGGHRAPVFFHIFTAHWQSCI